MRNYCLILLTLILCVSACRKKELPAPANPAVTDSVKTKGTIKIVIENKVGDQKLVLGNKYRLNTGDTLSVNVYNYYISNLIFTDIQGNTFAEPESYHLIRQGNPESLHLLIENIPFAKYKSLSFLIGIDSSRNVSGVQNGDLDPQFGMFWSWSSGYIMAKLEGKSPQSTLPYQTVAFHIAGFSGPYNTIQKVLLDFPEHAIISDQTSAIVHMSSDLSAWFRALIFPGFSTRPIINIKGKEAFDMALSYSSMMSIERIEKF